MRKRNILLISLLTLTLAILASIIVGNQSTYTWISDMVSEDSALATASDTIVAYVNESAISQTEINRCVLNLRILNEVERKNLEKKFKDGILDRSEFEKMTLSLEQRIQDMNLFGHVTQTLIKDETYYQAALQVGYQPNLEEASTYEKLAYQDFDKNQQKILTAVSKGYGLTYSEYAEDYLAPVRVKKWAKAYLDNYILEALQQSEEYLNLPLEELRTLPEYLEALENCINAVTVTMNIIE